MSKSHVYIKSIGEVIAEMDDRMVSFNRRYNPPTYRWDYETATQVSVGMVEHVLYTKSERFRTCCSICRVLEKIIPWYIAVENVMTYSDMNAMFSADALNLSIIMHDMVIDPIEGRMTDLLRHITDADDGNTFYSVNFQPRNASVAIKNEGDWRALEYERLKRERRIDPSW